MRKLGFILILSIALGFGYGIIQSQADDHQDIIDRFYSNEVSLSERMAYELHVIVDSMLCDCTNELGYALPTGEGIKLAVNRRITFLDASKEEKNQLKQLVENYVSLPENSLSIWESRIDSIKEELEKEKAKDKRDQNKIDELESDLTRYQDIYNSNKQTLKVEILEIHNLIEKIDDRMNGSYFEDEHDRKGIDT